MIIVVRMQPNEIQSQPWNAVYFAVFFIIYSNRYTIYSQIDSSILQHKLCIATCSSYKHQHWCTKNNEQLKSQNDLESIQIKTRLKCIVWIWFDSILSSCSQCIRQDILISSCCFFLWLPLSSTLIVTIYFMEQVLNTLATKCSLIFLIETRSKT